MSDFRATMNTVPEIIAWSRSSIIHNTRTMGLTFNFGMEINWLYLKSNVYKAHFSLLFWKWCEMDPLWNANAFKQDQCLSPLVHVSLSFLPEEGYYVQKRIFAQWIKNARKCNDLNSA